MKSGALFSAFLLVILAGCANDKQIISAVTDDIKADSGLGAHQVTVGSHNGIVTLDGFVTSEGKRKDVGRIATRVDGVSEVRNHLAVRQPSTSGPQGNVCDRVMEAVSAQGKGIKVSCEGTSVTLRGSAASEDAARRIGRTAMGTPEVTSVVNLLTTPAPLSDKVLDERVQRAVETLNEYNVSHYVQNRVVFFTGFVPVSGKLDRILSAARMVEGVRDVKSTVQIGGNVNF